MGSQWDPQRAAKGHGEVPVGPAEVPVGPAVGNRETCGGPGFLILRGGWWAPGEAKCRRVLFGDPTHSKPHVLQRPLSTRGSHVAGTLAPAG